MRTRKAGKWTETFDETFTRNFGPITATVSRVWDYREPDPSHYKGWLSVGGTEFKVSIASLGVEWFDDRCPRLACKAMERLIKAEIKNWLK